MTYKNNLPGAEELLTQKCNLLLQQGDNSEAITLATEAPKVSLRRYNRVWLEELKCCERLYLLAWQGCMYQAPLQLILNTVLLLLL